MFISFISYVLLINQLIAYEFWDYKSQMIMSGNKTWTFIYNKKYFLNLLKYFWRQQMEPISNTWHLIAEGKYSKPQVCVTFITLNW